MQRFCIVCGHDITGRWPAKVCSGLCRLEAKRRKEKRRNVAYKVRKAARKATRVKAKRREAADHRKELNEDRHREYLRDYRRCQQERAAKVARELAELAELYAQWDQERVAQLREQQIAAVKWEQQFAAEFAADWDQETAKQQEQKHAIKLWQLERLVERERKRLTKRIANCPLGLWSKPEYAEYRSEYNKRRRLRRLLSPEKRAKDQEYNRKRREKYVTEKAVVVALRKLGWLDGYDIITDPTNHEPRLQARKRSLEARRRSGVFQVIAADAMRRVAHRAWRDAKSYPLRGQIIRVNRKGIAKAKTVDKAARRNLRIVLKQRPLQIGNYRANWFNRYIGHSHNVPKHRRTTFRLSQFTKPKLGQRRDCDEHKRHDRQQRRDLFTTLEQLGWIKNGQIVDVPPLPFLSL